MSHPKSNESALQTLTKKIQKHCPELMELSFGCEIAYQYDNEGNTTRGIYINKSSHDGHEWFLDTERNTIFPFLKDRIEILGHPITLEHVLRAYGMQKIDTEADEAYFYRYTVPKVLFRWEWLKPLSEQSEETIEWLNSVIA